MHPVRVNMSKSMQRTTGLLATAGLVTTRIPNASNLRIAKGLRGHLAAKEKEPSSEEPGPLHIVPSPLGPCGRATASGRGSEMNGQRLVGGQAGTAYHDANLPTE